MMEVLKRKPRDFTGLSYWCIYKGLRGHGSWNLNRKSISIRRSDLVRSRQISAYTVNQQVISTISVRYGSDLLLYCINLRSYWYGPDGRCQRHWHRPASHHRRHSLALRYYHLLSHLR